MLDIKRIKEDPAAVKAALKAKEVDCDATIDRILELDGQIRALKTASETKTAQKNKLAKENGKLFGQKKGAEKKGEDTSALDAQIEANKAESVALDNAIADDAVLSFMKHSARNEVENIFLVSDHYRMSGVRTALKTDYDICFLCEEINDLALTFIAPLGTNKYCIHIGCIISNIRVFL
jgi:hypothetical protein